MKIEHASTHSPLTLWTALVHVRVWVHILRDHRGTEERSEERYNNNNHIIILSRNLMERYIEFRSGKSSCQSCCHCYCCCYRCRRHCCCRRRRPCCSIYMT